MKNIVNGLIQEFIKKNNTGNIAKMTIGELTLFVAGFLKHFEESVEHVLSEMTVSDLVSIQEFATDNACKQETKELSEEDKRQVMLERLAYARKCRLEKIAQRKAAESKCDAQCSTQRKRNRRSANFKPLKLYKRRPRIITEGCETYAVYDRCNGQRVNIMYANVPLSLEKKGVNVLKRSYSMQMGVNYLNVSCRRLDNRKDRKMSQNVQRY